MMIVNKVNKVMHCDNCKDRISMFEKGRKNFIGWAFPVETTEGRKMLCWKCLEAYNVLDRLPTIEERDAGWYSLMKRAD